jgi:lysophospholipid acyltransferase 1/2
MEAAQVRYFVMWIVSMPLGFLMYYGLHPSRTSPSVRHIYATTLGVIMGLLCFGWEMLILFVIITISYAILLLIPPRQVQRYIMVYSVFIIGCAHLIRMVYDYGTYSVDYTIPLMMLVQKFSLTAFALHDGLARKDEDLSEDQQQMKMEGVPPVLAYYGYCFNFLQFLTGPSCTYTEYVKFIDGTNFHFDNPNKYGKAKIHANGPSTILPWFLSLMAGLLFMAIFMMFDSQSLLDSYIGDERNVLEKVFYSWLVAIVFRCRYYMAWKISESIGNSAGLGFSGYDEKGNPQWETSKNCQPIGFELGTNMRGAIGAWNITTNFWLRRVCYTQVPRWPTLMTFLLSALWHGFYPSYYMSLITLAILVEAARKGRSVFRPYFIGNAALKFFYDVTTLLFTAVFISTGAISFLYLNIADSVKTYTDFYCLQVIIPIVFLLIPLKTHKRSKSTGKADGKDSQGADLRSLRDSAKNGDHPLVKQKGD